MSMSWNRAGQESTGGQKVIGGAHLYTFSQLLGQSPESPPPPPTPPWISGFCPIFILPSSIYCAWMMPRFPVPALPLPHVPSCLRCTFPSDPTNMPIFLPSLCHCPRSRPPLSQTAVGASLQEALVLTLTPPGLLQPTR